MKGMAMGTIRVVGTETVKKDWCRNNLNCIRDFIANHLENNHYSINTEETNIYTYKNQIRFLPQNKGKNKFQVYIKS
jgi:hypothetical protein